MELYLSIFKLFLNRDTFTKYKDAIDHDFLRDNMPELFRVFKALEHLHKGGHETYSEVDLEASVSICYPNSDASLYGGLCKRIMEAGGTKETLLEYLEQSSARAKAARVGLLSLDFAEGKVSREVLDAAIQSLGQPLDDIRVEEEFVSDDIELLYEKAVKDGGLKWRLGSLNRSLGPLRKGDFGFIFARPESGKTTFLADQATFFAEQVKEGEGPGLWFNNEEQGEKVGIRCYESALGATLAQVLGSKERARGAYLQRTKGNLRIKDDAGITRSRIEKLCSVYKPSFIIIDQLDKVQGFDGDREDLRMGAIYQWARELAKRFGPVIGVSQADGSGEGIKYLKMGNVANAKTAKQAEADWILGIGLSYEDPPNIRGFSICKNKLLGGEESIPKMRHASWEVLLDAEIGRYKDVAHG